MSYYDRLTKIGEGTHATVFKGKHKISKEIVALKIFYVDEEIGLPSSALREICMLKQISHPNVIKLLDLVYDASDQDVEKPPVVTLVFEYWYQDLKNYCDSIAACGRLVEPCTVRNLMFQLFSGLSYCHSQNILHRDIKPQNILINETTNELKITDFGLARAVTLPIPCYASEAVTLWYRPPELLLGANCYTTSVDVWSAGCIFAELSNSGSPLLPGSDIDSQLKITFRLLLGVGLWPTEQSWPGITNLPDYLERLRKASKSSSTHIDPKSPLTSIKQAVPNLSSCGRDLIRQILVCNPSARLSVQKILSHPYFKDDSEGNLGYDEFKEERRTEIKNHQILAKIKPQKRSSEPSVGLHRAQSEASTNTLLTKYREHHRKSAHL